MKNAVAEMTLTAPTLAVALTPMEMLDRAVSSGASPETLEKLMNLQERWEATQAKKAFDAAMASVKAELPTIIKTKQVKASGSYGFKHETLTGIARQIDPILAQHGLSYRFRTSSDATTVTVICVMSHKLGHSEETSLTGPHDKSGGKNSIQAVGSAVTYLERYSLKAALGMSAADDDDAALVDTGDAMSPITEADAKKLIADLDEAGADKAAFCAFFGIDGVALLPRGKLAEANTMVSAKKNKKGGK